MKKRKITTFPVGIAIPVLIFLLAFCLRIIYLNQIRINSPFFDFPIGDAQLYVSWAEELAGGNWLGDEVFWASPLYPYFLGAIFRLFGKNFYLLRVIQVFIGSLSCVLIYCLGKKVFSRSVGLIAAFLAATYGLFILYDNLLLATFLGIFLNLSAVLCIIRANEQPNAGRYFLAGLISGLAGLARPNILLFLPFFLIWTAVVRRRQGFRFALKNIPAFVLGVVLMIAPVTIRNYLVGKELVFISSQGGINFYIGNHPGAGGTYRTVKGISDVPGEQLKDFHRLAEKSLGRKLLPSQASRFWLEKGLAFIRNHPLNWLELTGRKFALFWKGEEVDPQLSYYFRRRYSRLLQLPLPSFVLLSPLALMGIVLSWKNRRRAGLLYLFISCYLATILLFFVTARYRLPAVPFLIVFAAYALWWWLAELKKKKFRPVIITLALTGVLAILTRFPHVPRDFAPSHCNLGFIFEVKNLPEEAVRQYREAIRVKPDYAEAHNNLGRLYASLGRHEEALRQYRKCLELEPGLVEVHINLGALYDRKGMLSQAAAEYRKALELAPESAEAYNNLGAVCVRQGLTEEAMEHYQKALAVNPDFLASRINLADLYFNLGRLKEAAAEYREVLRMVPDNPDAHFKLGLLYLQTNRAEEALPELRRVLELRPGLIQVHNYLAAIYQQQGRFKEAISEYQKLLTVQPESPEALNNLGYLYVESGLDPDRGVELIQKALSLRPENPGFLDSLGWAYFKQGRLEEAQALLEKALNLSTSKPRIARIYGHLAYVYEKKNLPQKAAECWEAVLDLEPQNPEAQEGLERLKKIYK